MTTDLPLAEKDVIARLKNRDQEGARQLVRNYGDRLLRSAHLLCDNKADAEDLVQRTFVEAVRSINRFRGESALYTWLHGILLNVTRSHYRLQRLMRFTYRFPTQEIMIPPGQLGESLDKGMSRLAVLVEHLPPPYREAIVLRFYEGMKVEEIALKKMIPVSTVKTHLRRALQWLRKSLQKNETF